jgi:hypothetical protein
MKSYLPLKVYIHIMKDEAELKTVEVSNKTTLKDAGKGLIILGAAILVLTGMSFIMSIWENEYYGLFSGRTHLAFTLVLGLALLVTGSLLLRSKPVKIENSGIQS